MGHLQNKINIKILEGMNVNTYRMEGTKLVVSSSKKIEPASVSQEDIDLAIAVFNQDNMILDYCERA